MDAAEAARRLRLIGRAEKELEEQKKAFVYGVKCVSKELRLAQNAGAGCYYHEVQTWKIDGEMVLVEFLDDEEFNAPTTSQTFTLQLLVDCLTNPAAYKEELARVEKNAVEREEKRAAERRAEERTRKLQEIQRLKKEIGET